MIMADVLKIFLLVLGALVVLVAYLLAAHALAPRRVVRASEALGSWRRIVAALAVGLPSAGFALAIALALQATGNLVGRGLGLALAIVPLALAITGVAGVALRIGRGLPSPIDRDAPWRAVLRGSIVLALCYLLPIVGWFVVFPATFAFGLGAAVLALRPSARRAARTARAETQSWGQVA